MDDNLFPRCPACGDPVDFCQGHGAIGDPEGASILEAHDEGQHDGCHNLACPEPEPESDPRCSRCDARTYGDADCALCRR